MNFRFVLKFLSFIDQRISDSTSAVTLDVGTTPQRSHASLNEGEILLSDRVHSMPDLGLYIHELTNPANDTSERNYQNPNEKPLTVIDQNIASENRIILNYTAVKNLHDTSPKIINNNLSIKKIAKKSSIGNRVNNTKTKWTQKLSKMQHSNRFSVSENGNHDDPTSIENIILPISDIKHNSNRNQARSNEQINSKDVSTVSESNLPSQQVNVDTTEEPPSGINLQVVVSGEKFETIPPDTIQPDHKTLHSNLKPPRNRAPFIFLPTQRRAKTPKSRAILDQEVNLQRDHAGIVFTTLSTTKDGNSDIDLAFNADIVEKDASLDGPTSKNESLKLDLNAINSPLSESDSVTSFKDRSLSGMIENSNDKSATNTIIQLTPLEYKALQSQERQNNMRLGDNVRGKGNGEYIPAVTIPNLSSNINIPKHYDDVNESRNDKSFSHVINELEWKITYPGNNTVTDFGNYSRQMDSELFIIKKNHIQKHGENNTNDINNTYTTNVQESKTPKMINETNQGNVRFIPTKYIANDIPSRKSMLNFNSNRMSSVSESPLVSTLSSRLLKNNFQESTNHQLLSQQYEKAKQSNTKDTYIPHVANFPHKFSSYQSSDYGHESGDSKEKQKRNLFDHLGLPHQNLWTQGKSSFQSANNRHFGMGYYTKPRHSTPTNVDNTMRPYGGISRGGQFNLNSFVRDRNDGGYRSKHDRQAKGFTHSITNLNNLFLPLNMPTTTPSPLTTMFSSHYKQNNYDYLKYRYQFDFQPNVAVTEQAIQSTPKPDIWYDRVLGIKVINPNYPKRPIRRNTQNNNNNRLHYTQSQVTYRNNRHVPLYSIPIYFSTSRPVFRTKTMNVDFMKRESPHNGINAYYQSNWNKNPPFTSIQNSNIPEKNRVTLTDSHKETLLFGNDYSKTKSQSDSNDINGLGDNFQYFEGSFVNQRGTINPHLNRNQHERGKGTINPNNNQKPNNSEINDNSNPYLKTFFNDYANSTISRDTPKLSNETNNTKSQDLNLNIDIRSNNSYLFVDRNEMATKSPMMTTTSSFFQNYISTSSKGTDAYNIEYTNRTPKYTNQGKLQTKMTSEWSRGTTKKTVSISRQSQYNNSNHNQTEDSRPTQTQFTHSSRPTIKTDDTMSSVIDPLLRLQKSQKNPRKMAYSSNLQSPASIKDTYPSLSPSSSFQTLRIQSQRNHQPKSYIPYKDRKTNRGNPTLTPNSYYGLNNQIAHQRVFTHMPTWMQSKTTSNVISLRQNGRLHVPSKNRQIQPKPYQLTHGPHLNTYNQFNSANKINNNNGYSFNNNNDLNYPYNKIEKMVDSLNTENNRKYTANQRIKLEGNQNQNLAGPIGFRFDSNSKRKINAIFPKQEVLDIPGSLINQRRKHNFPENIALTTFTNTSAPDDNDYEYDKVFTDGIQDSYNRYSVFGFPEQPLPYQVFNPAHAVLYRSPYIFPLAPPNSYQFQPGYVVQPLDPNVTPMLYSLQGGGPEGVLNVGDNRNLNVEGKSQRPNEGLNAGFSESFKYGSLIGGQGEGRIEAKTISDDVPINTNSHTGISEVRIHNPNTIYNNMDYGEFKKIKSLQDSPTKIQSLLKPDNINNDNNINNNNYIATQPRPASMKRSQSWGPNDLFNIESSVQKQRNDDNQQPSSIQLPPVQAHHQYTKSITQQSYKEPSRIEYIRNLNPPALYTGSINNPQSPTKSRKTIGQNPHFPEQPTPRYFPYNYNAQRPMSPYPQYVMNVPNPIPRYTGMQNPNPYYPFSYPWNRSGNVPSANHNEINPRDINAIEHFLYTQRFFPHRPTAYHPVIKNIQYPNSYPPYYPPQSPPVQYPNPPHHLTNMDIKAVEHFLYTYPYYKKKNKKQNTGLLGLANGNGGVGGGLQSLLILGKK